MRRFVRSVWLVAAFALLPHIGFAGTDYTAPYPDTTSEGGCGTVAGTATCEVEKYADVSGALHASLNAVSGAGGLLPGVASGFSSGAILIPIAVPDGVARVIVRAHAIVDAVASRSSTLAGIGSDYSQASIQMRSDFFGAYGYGSYYVATFGEVQWMHGDVDFGLELDDYQGDLQGTTVVMSVGVYADLSMTAGGSYAASIDATVDRVSVEMVLYASP